MQKEKLKKIKKMLATCFLFLTFAAIFSAGMLWQYFQEHPQKEYEYSNSPLVEFSDNGELIESKNGMPHELKYKLDLMNRIRNILIACVLVFWVWFYIDYKIEPENHIIQKIRNMANKAGKEAE